MVEDEVNFKTLTGVSNVKVTHSTWKLLKMLFGFGNKTEIIPVTVDVTRDEESIDENPIVSRLLDNYPFEMMEGLIGFKPVGSSFVRQVIVHSKHKDKKGRWIKHEAQCTFDTGNQQGNFVSKEFLVSHLGFSEKDFRCKKFTGVEKSGRSATGHLNVPEGMICLTWYVQGGPRMFRHMRFLVSTNIPCDLNVGASSIEEYSILGSLNLMASPTVDKNIIIFQTNTGQSKLVP